MAIALQSLIVSSSFVVPSGACHRGTASIPSLKKRTRPIGCVVNVNSSSSSINIIKKPDEDEVGVIRRSGNYPPSCWDYTTVQSLESNFTEEKYGKQADKLKNDVKNLIVSDMAPLAKLELIDSVQRLGLEYQFQVEIKQELDHLEKNNNLFKDDYHHAFLAFRIFRQHGFVVSAETLRNFTDERGSFRASLCCDAKGLLNLYEASFFGFKGETILDEARSFAASNLNAMIVNGGGSSISPILAKKIQHALDMPLHWRVPRVEARWYIETCQEEEEAGGGGCINTSFLLEFAKLDYNMVQYVHQKEVKELAEWWKETGMSKMNFFARDRLVEHFFWCCGIMFEPQYRKFREVATKVICFTSIIDDVYDVYGTVAELEIVTHFIDRWDISGIDMLPYNIKMCLLSFYNTMNDIGYWFLKEIGINIIPSLSKAWGDLCKLYLFEAKCYHGGASILKLEEYLAYSIITVAAPVVLYAAYYFTTEDKLTAEGCNNVVANLPHIMYCSCRIIRLTDDLGTSSAELQRGDNMKAIECYMNEAGVGEEEARKHLKHLVIEGWKDMNKELMMNNKPDGNPFTLDFLRANLNFTRTGHCIYQFGDGHGFPYDSTKDNITNLLVKPIP